MRYLGLDLGTKTLGLALSDKGGIIATSLKTLLIDNGNYDKVIDDLLLVVNDYQIETMVLGLPKNMDNTIGPRAQATLDFKDLLASRTDLEVHLQDERLSTKEVTDMLISADVSRKKRKKVVDKLAATIILQNYLNRIN